MIALQKTGLDEQSIRDIIPKQRQVEGPVRSCHSVLVNITESSGYWNRYDYAKTEDWGEFVVISRRNIMGTCLFRTSKGYFGLGPPALQADDLVCIFPGIRLPLILRLRGSHYQLVGTCFIYGLMDGEAVGGDIHGWEASLTDFYIM